MSTAHNRSLCAAVLAVQRAAETVDDVPAASRWRSRAMPKELKSVPVADWLTSVRLDAAFLAFLNAS